MLKKYTQLRRSYDHTFFYGLATSAINALSSGALVTAFAVALGAGNIALGFLWAVQPLSSLMHLPVSYFIEKGVSLKKIAVFSSLICRPFWLIAASVVFLKGQTALTVFVISYFFAFIIWSVSGGAFYPWIKQLVHPRLINRFLAHRIKYILLTKTVIASLAAGVIWMIQKYRPDWEIYSYAVFFVLAFLFGLEATWHLGRMADRKIIPVPTKSFISKVLFTLKNASFKRLLLSLSAVNFSMNFIMPFVMVFMLKQLGLSVGVSMAFTILCQLTDCFTLARWSARASRKGVGRTMMEACLIYIAAVSCLILLGILSVQGGVLLAVLVGVHLLIGIGSSGLNLGINDVVVSYVPWEMASVYISVNNTFRFLFAAMGPVAAGIVLDGLKVWAPVYAWRLFFMCAGVLFAGTIGLLSKMTQVETMFCPFKKTGR